MTSYFCSLVLAGSPCHGKPPLIKYMSTIPIYSRSSLLAYSTPIWVLRLAYLAVPVNCLLSLYEICLPVRGSLYLLASPKSMIYSTCYCLPIPIRKLSGLISLCRKPCWWMNSHRCNIYIASIKTVLCENLRRQYSYKSSKEGPNSSMTKTLYSDTLP